MNNNNKNKLRSICCSLKGTRYFNHVCTINKFSKLKKKKKIEAPLIMISCFILLIFSLLESAFLLRV